MRSAAGSPFDWGKIVRRKIRLPSKPPALMGVYDKIKRIKPDGKGRMAVPGAGVFVPYAQHIRNPVALNLDELLVRIEVFMCHIVSLLEAQTHGARNPVAFAVCFSNLCTILAMMCG